MFSLLLISLVFVFYCTPTQSISYDAFLVSIHKLPASTIEAYSVAIPKQRSPRKYRSHNNRLEIGSKKDRIENKHAKEIKLERSGENWMDIDELFGNDKIVGGEEVNINNHPYHVAYGHNCAAALIDKVWAMTAAHCGKKPHIIVGSKYYNQGERIPVKRNFIHPGWGASKKEHPFDFDYQLLELGKPVKFGENAQPIELARMSDMVAGKTITVTGWGHTREHGTYSNVLRAISVPVITKEKCQKVPFPYFKGSLTPRMFCAGYTNIRVDACQGDSGGPAVSNDRLMGMVSFGYGCATPGSFGVYSKIPSVIGWINNVTGLHFKG